MEVFGAGVRTGPARPGDLIRRTFSEEDLPAAVASCRKLHKLDPLRTRGDSRGAVSPGQWRRSDNRLSLFPGTCLEGAPASRKGRKSHHSGTRTEAWSPRTTRHSWPPPGRPTPEPRVRTTGGRGRAALRR